MTPTRKTVLGAGATALVAAFLYTTQPAPVADAYFRTYDKQHVLTVEPNGEVVADRTQANAWEMFKVERVGTKITLKSAHGKYLAAEPDGTLVANRSVADVWEQFEVVSTNGGIGLKSHHGTFVVAENGGGGVVRVNRKNLGPWETFASSVPLSGSENTSNNSTIGRLRVTPQGYADDTGVVLPLYAHAGNLFSLYTRDASRAREELDSVAAAGYRGVRVWSTLGGSYWQGDHVGPEVTPDYWGKVRAFAGDLRARGLRAVWSQGDVGQLRDRRDYMSRLAAVDNDVPFIDFIDCGNEAWQTGEPDPNRLAQCVGYYQAAGGKAIRSLTSPPGETKDLLDQYSIPPAEIWDVHSERAQHSWDKRRHIFSISYEGKPRLRYGINSEPPGNGALVSASDNKAELDDEAVALLGVAAAMSRQAYVWFSGEGVKIRQGLKVESGFAATPKALNRLPKSLMSWPVLHHSGDRFRGTRILAAVDEVRVDCAQEGGRQFVCTIDGPAGNYQLPVEKSFTGRLCNPGTDVCVDVGATAGARLPVSFTRGRVLLGQTQ